MAIHAYARVSTNEQCLDLQLDALKNIKYDYLYTDKISGSSIKNRPGLNSLLENVSPGDKVYVWRLDRLGRSMKDLLEIVNNFQDNNIEFVSITESIKTDSINGKFFFHLAAALSEMEKELLKNRTLMGLEAARLRGRIGGRPKSLNSNKLVKVKEMIKQGFSVTEVAEIMRISRSTIYRYL